jgi:SH3-like domain-containing protein
MSGRYHWLISSLAVCALAAPALLAQEAVQVQPEVQNSRFQFSGVTNSADVYVRSGPGEAWYATQRLPQGTQVTVVGIKFDWLKIQPPDGSFCYVSKLYVDRVGDGSVGRVTRSDINVRAGSSLNAMKTTVLCQLMLGDQVKILGDQDEYYKIVPPQGTFFYVNKQFINPVRAVGVNTQTAPPAPDNATSSDNPVVAAAEPATQPSAAIVTETPTSQPSVATAPPAPSPGDVAEAQFAALETEFNTASAKPLEEQPAADLAKRYDALVKNDALPASDRETAGFRLAVLKVRVDAQARLADLKKVEEAAAQRDKMLKAEQQELQQRLDANQVTLYAAVGQIQPSSLQAGAQTLYRLVDPATGRTLIYARGDDTDAVKLMGQFVGVRGDASMDSRLNLKVIDCTVIETVDPSQVNTKVMAGITPPSLLSPAVQAADKASASTGN